MFQFVASTYHMGAQEGAHRYEQPEMNCPLAIFVKNLSLNK